MNITSLCDKLPLDGEAVEALTVQDPLGRLGTVRLTPEHGSDRGRVTLDWHDSPEATIVIFTWDGATITWSAVEFADLTILELATSLTIVELAPMGWDEDPFDLCRVQAPAQIQPMAPDEVFKHLYGGQP